MVARTPNGDPSASQQAHELGDRLRQTAHDTGQQIKEQTARAASGLQNKIDSYVDQRRTQLADSVGSLAAAVQESSKKMHEQKQDQLAPVLDSAAARLESLAQYMQHASVRDITQDIADLARRRPEVFLGGALFAGFVAARLIKSSGDVQEFERRAIDYGSAAVEQAEETFGGDASGPEAFPDIEATGGGVPGSSHIPDISPSIASGPTAAKSDAEGPDTITPMGSNAPTPDVFRSQDEPAKFPGMGSDMDKDKNKPGNSKRPDQGRA